MTPTAMPLSAPVDDFDAHQVSRQGLPVQRPLVAPGWCANGCGLRLSVLDTDGICLACRVAPLPDEDAPPPPSKPSPWLTLLCQCGASFLARHKDKQYCPACTQRRHTQAQEQRRATAPNTAASAGRGAG